MIHPPRRRERRSKDGLTGGRRGGSVGAKHVDESLNDAIKARAGVT